MKHSKIQKKEKFMINTEKKVSINMNNNNNKVEVSRILADLVADSKKCFLNSFVEVAEEEDNNSILIVDLGSRNNIMKNLKKKICLKIQMFMF